MFGAIRALTGNIEVKEEDGIITISGITSKKFADSIYKYWKTRRIADYMFVKRTSFSISFYSFYAIDFMYMFEELKTYRYVTMPRSSINRIVEDMKTNTWLRNIYKDYPPRLNSSKLSLFHKKPLEHQLKFFDLYNTNVPKYGLNGYVLALDTGAGKTLTSLMTAEQLNSDIIITLCPARALENVWRLAYNEEYKQPQTSWTSRDNTPFPSKKPTKGIILHYESLVNYYDDILALAKTGKRITLIVDESHSFNEITAQRTQLLIELTNKVKFDTVLWLSATPIKALGTEMIPMLRSFDPLMTEQVSESFRKVFGKNAAKGSDILKNRMGIISYVVKIDKSKPEIFDLPVKIPNPEPYILENIKKEMREFIMDRVKYYRDNYDKYYAIYKQCLDYYERRADTKQLLLLKEYKRQVAIIIRGYDPATMVEIAKYCNDFENNEVYPILPPELKKEWKNCKSVIKYVDLKVRGECLGRIVGKKRAEAVVDMIPYIGLETIIRNSAKKVVIFTSYVIGVDETVKYLESKGIPALYVHGDNSKEVPRIVGEFDKNPKYKVLVATYASMSSAIPLVMANTMVMLNQNFRSHDRQQAIGRIDRINQDTQTEVYDVLMDTGDKPNITTRTLDILKWSEEQVAAIMGKDSDHKVEISYESVSSKYSPEELSIKTFNRELVRDIENYFSTLDLVDTEIDEIYLFGSFARGEGKRDSDLDILVTFRGIKDGRRSSIFNFPSERTEVIELVRDFLKQHKSSYPDIRGIDVVGIHELRNFDKEIFNEMKLLYPV